MKKLLMFSVLALGLAMSSCTEDGLHNDPSITTIADDTGGMTGHTNTPPPPPPPPPKP